MVEILEEIEQNAFAQDGTPLRGDITQMLELLAVATAGPRESPRAVAAMRKAWWRWKTDGQGATTPPVIELAQIVRYAKGNGWLRNLTSPGALRLVSRLMQALRDANPMQRRESEHAWREAVKEPVDQLIAGIEPQLTRHAATQPRSSTADMHRSALVQMEVHAMVTGFFEQLIRTLEEPRKPGNGQGDGQPLLQPREGWPDALMSMAADISKILNRAADDMGSIEKSLQRSAG